MNGEKTMVDRIRRMPRDVAEAYSRGLKSIWDFNPQTRLYYSSADIAFVESMAKQSGRLDYNKAFDPSQPRDSTGKWTVTGRADLPKLSKTLTRYRTVPLDEEDVQRAVAAWEHMHFDHGDSFVREVVEDRANELLRGKWSLEGRRDLAVLAWMADRLRKGE